MSVEMDDWVFSGIPGYFRVILGILDIISFFGSSEPNIDFFLTFIEG